MHGDTATKFIARLRETRDPNWSDLEHLLRLVWIGEVIAKPEEGDLKAENAKLRGLLWYAWHEFNAIRAMSGAPLAYDGMTTVAPEYWEQMLFAFADAIGGDALTPWPSPEARGALDQPDRAATNAIGNMRHAFEIADAEYERDTRARTMGGPDE